MEVTIILIMIFALPVSYCFVKHKSYACHILYIIPIERILGELPAVPVSDT